jgi:hypothetical protein
MSKRGKQGRGGQGMGLAEYTAKMGEYEMKLLPLLSTVGSQVPPDD